MISARRAKIKSSDTELSLFSKMTLKSHVKSYIKYKVAQRENCYEFSCLSDAELKYIVELLEKKGYKLTARQAGYGYDWWYLKVEW